MTTNSITHVSPNHKALVPDNANGHQKHRLLYFAQWLDANGGAWIQPDLAAYRDYLLTEYRGRDNRPLSPTSTAAHLSTIRGRYQALIDDPALRDYILYQTRQDGRQLSPADEIAMMNEAIKRLELAVKPARSKVKIIKVQDEDEGDGKHHRLNRAQASDLPRRPLKHADNSPLQTLRDMAMLSLMLATGVREMELIGLNVEDLRARGKGNVLALKVRKGKGAKQRLIPYGALEDVLAIVDRWLFAAGIETGPVFRGFYRGGKKVRPTRLTVRAVNQVLDKYPIYIDGKPTRIQPHDLRRTYARLLYDDGMNIRDIRDNLGHASIKTTEKYVGAGTMESRKPQAVFDLPDMSELPNPAM